MTQGAAYEVLYSSATGWLAEGARVGIVTCLTCGAAVFLSMDAPALRLHTEWHQAPASEADR